MTFEEFDKYQADIISQVVEMKSTKGKEYANSESRFANFDRLAEKEEISRLKVAHIFFTKHMDAIESFIKNGKTFSTESIHGRIVDAITYLTLIGGMIFEDECKPKVERLVANNLDRLHCRKCFQVFNAGESIYTKDPSGPIIEFYHTKCPDQSNAIATTA